jgi:hypothetical protein
MMPKGLREAYRALLARRGPALESDRPPVSTFEGGWRGPQIPGQLSLGQELELRRREREDELGDGDHGGDGGGRAA